MSRQGHNIAFVIDSMAGGGAQRVVANLANHWSAQGHRVSVITLAGATEDAYTLLPSAQRIALNMYGNSTNSLVALQQNLRRARALRRQLRQLKPDVAIGAQPTGNVLLALASRGMAVTAIGSEHTHCPLQPMNLYWRALRYFTYGWLDAVTAPTEETALWLQRHTKARRTVTIPNPIVYPLPAQPPIVAPEQVLPTDCPCIIAVGRLEPVKGFDWLIDAFSRIAAMHPNWNLVVVGEGNARPDLEKQVAELGLRLRVHLPGWVGNVGDWYQRASVVAMTSRVEGFGNTLAEGMAYGLPAVAFDCEVGPRAIVRDGVDGILVRLGEVEQFARALSELMQNEVLRDSFAHRAVEARHRFGIQTVAKRWEQLLEQACTHCR
jgi:glycosyltransferase involved in cell wall biosynthesis